MPTREHVQEALSKIKTSADYEYFFDRLSTPDWIDPLRESGIFSSPAAARKEGGGTWFPNWPPSRYLVRVAAEAPEKVAAVIADIPETDNVRIHEDFVDAALAMPAEIAESLLQPAIRWIESSPYFLLPQKLADLVVHLAAADRVRAALDLSRGLLALRPEARPTLSFDDDDEVQYSSEPKPLFDDWDYQEILRKVTPVLVDRAGEETLAVLVDLLEAAVLITSGMDERPTAATEDLSYIWRPAVEEHDQNIGGDAKNSLVVAVRDASMQLIESNPDGLPDLVQDFLRRPWRIFHRIALYLLEKFGERHMLLVEQILRDMDLLDELAVRHEMALLARRHFASLPVPVQLEIVRAIDEGFDEEEFRRRYAEARGEAPTDELVREWNAHRRRDLLAMIGRESLPESARELLDTLVAEFGEPTRDPAEASFSVSWVGPTSPLDVDALREKSVEETVELLREWTPSGEHMAPSPEGLGRVLSAVVEEDPQKWSTAATQFIEVDPTYVRGLLWGLREALRQKRGVNWEPVIALSDWIVAQPRDIPGREGEYTDLDPGWVWARKALADLLTEGFSSQPLGPPFELRARCWTVIEPLTQDPEPTSEYEAQYGGDNMDPATLSINTVRGQTMHAAIYYGLWVRRHRDEGPGDFSLNVVPELADVLNAHLDTSVDSSLTIRAVYGWRFPQLMLLDRTWAADNYRAVFPADQDVLFEAAWAAYVKFNPPYDEVVELIDDVYVQAIDRLDSTADETAPYTPEARLADHVMTLYWRGKFFLETENGLLQRLVDKAPPSLLGEALNFIGRSAREVEQLDDDLRDRLQNLWGWLKERKSPDSAGFKSFGWWFGSGRFDPAWALRELQWVLENTRDADPRHLVAEELARLAPLYPKESVLSLRLLVETRTKQWEIYGIRDEARIILDAALSSKDANTKEIATQQVHALGARGFREFRDLLR